MYVLFSTIDYVSQLLHLISWLGRNKDKKDTYREESRNVNDNSSSCESHTRPYGTTDKHINLDKQKQIVCISTLIYVLLMLKILIIGK